MQHVPRRETSPLRLGPFGRSGLQDRLPTAVLVVGIACTGLVGLLTSPPAAAQTGSAPPPPSLQNLPTRPATAAPGSATAAPPALPEPQAASHRPALPSTCAATRTLTAGTPARVAPPSASTNSDGTAAARNSQTERDEPAVECIVIDDDKHRIEELRVRGQTQRIIVRPKDGSAPYEIQLLDAGRDPTAKSGPGRGGAGQRVWPVMSF